MSEWIRITTALPIPSWENELLAYGVPKCGTCGHYPRIELCSFCPEDGFCFGEYGCGLDATHWMPLPEKPNE